MGVYYIGSCDITDPAEFQEYPPVVMSLLPKSGGKGLASPGVVMTELRVPS